MTTNTPFLFKLGDPVRMRFSTEQGVVIGRAEHLEAEPSYCVRYLAGDGRQVEQWWGEKALALVVPPVPEAG